jgi:hypothetical protein
MTAGHPLDGLIDAALPGAMQLTVCVHDRDAQGVAEVLAPLLRAGDPEQLSAFMVALAALADPDSPVDDALAWSHENEPMGPQLPLGELIVGAGEKPCRECRAVLPLTDFHVDNSRRDGRTGVCRFCKNVGEPSGWGLYVEARSRGLSEAEARRAAGLSRETAWEYAYRFRKAAAEAAA